jgi:hypothetical protein
VSWEWDDVDTGKFAPFEKDSVLQLQLEAAFQSNILRNFVCDDKSCEKCANGKVCKHFNMCQIPVLNQFNKSNDEFGIPDWDDSKGFDKLTGGAKIYFLDFHFQDETGIIKRIEQVTGSYPNNSCNTFARQLKRFKKRRNSLLSYFKNTNDFVKFALCTTHISSSHYFYIFVNRFTFSTNINMNID